MVNQKILKIAALIFLSTVALIGLKTVDKTIDNKKSAMKNETDPKIDYQKEVEEFRTKAEERLKSPDNWLSVVGLDWLKDGVNTVGSASDNQIKLPQSAPKKLGTIRFSEKTGATIRFLVTENVTLDGNPVASDKDYPLADDTQASVSKVSVGTITFFAIKRKNGMGVRIKDTEADTRKNFAGRKWYPVDSKFKISARWVPHTQPKKISIPDVIGNLNEEVSPGYAEFNLDGQVIQLHPTQEGENLFFVFRDLTSGKDSYGASRFLYAQLESKNANQPGFVTLDFNKSYNPPCAFTKFATCPLPPKENILKVAIRAGELKPLVDLTQSL